MEEGTTNTQSNPMISNGKPSHNIVKQRNAKPSHNIAQNKTDKKIENQNNEEIVNNENVIVKKKSGN